MFLGEQGCLCYVLWLEFGFSFLMNFETCLVFRAVIDPVARIFVYLSICMTNNLNTGELRRVSNDQKSHPINRDVNAMCYVYIHPILSLE